MSFLTVNHNDAGEGKGEFSPIPEGIYEAIIKEIEVTQSKAGNDMLKITLVIRDDVKQQAQKRKVWDYLVASEKAKWRFNQMAKALNIPDGAKINTIQEFAKGIMFAPIKIEIKHQQDEYNGKTKTRETVAKYLRSDKLSNPDEDPFTVQTPAPPKNNSIPF